MGDGTDPNEELCESLEPLRLVDGVLGDESVGVDDVEADE